MLPGHLMLVYSLPNAIDDTAKGGLTLFWELFTVILCALKVSNVNNIDIWRPLDLKLKMKAL